VAFFFAKALQNQASTNSKRYRNSFVHGSDLIIMLDYIITQRYPSAFSCFVFVNRFSKLFFNTRDCATIHFLNKPFDSLTFGAIRQGQLRESLVLKMNRGSILAPSLLHADCQKWSATFFGHN